MNSWYIHKHGWILEANILSEKKPDWNDYIPYNSISLKSTKGKPAGVTRMWVWVTRRLNCKGVWKVFRVMKLLRIVVVVMWLYAFVKTYQIIPLNLWIRLHISYTLVSCTKDSAFSKHFMGASFVSGTFLRENISTLSKQRRCLLSRNSHSKLGVGEGQIINTQTRNMW